MEIWLKERKLFKLFFNRDSKGNPGVAGGGGIIISVEQNHMNMNTTRILELTQITWLKLMGCGKGLSKWKL